ncbi:hypothetical protein Syun_025829 [Stephania yunnanensis]|uniref:Uncharacterized protein n=1 Tax=Stephania yunnanensis TaxID=152371 RepID=A0AAP0F194_9MAGN
MHHRLIGINAISVFQFCSLCERFCLISRSNEVQLLLGMLIEFDSLCGYFCEIAHLNVGKSRVDFDLGKFALLESSSIDDDLASLKKEAVWELEGIVLYFSLINCVIEMETKILHLSRLSQQSSLLIFQNDSRN